MKSVLEENLWPLFSISENSKSGLCWSEDYCSGYFRKYYYRRGDIAGRLDSKGYWVVCVDGTDYKVHRIILEKSIGRLLGNKELVDHINGDVGDNSIENLRLVDARINGRNQCNRTVGQSGELGVSRRLIRGVGRSYPVWEAYWHNNEGKQIRRSFSVGKYGELEAKRLALRCRNDAIKIIGGYTPKHGTNKPIQILKGEIK